MAYEHFEEGLPQTTQTREETIDTARISLMALRDAVIMGYMPGWDLTPGDSSSTASPTFTSVMADASQPGLLKYENTNDEEILVWLTWSSGNVTVAKFYYAPSNISGYPANRLLIGTQTISYDGSSNVTGIVWS